VTLDAAMRLQPLATRAAQAYSDAPDVRPNIVGARGEPDEVVTLLRALLSAVSEQSEGMKGRAARYRPDPVAVLGLLLGVLSFFGYERVSCAFEVLLRELTR
jgi:hypothetical protein